MQIERIALKGGEELQPTLFNVIVGGNAVGKTTFLIELFDKMCGINRSRWYWIDIPRYASADIRGDMTLLCQSMARRWEGTNLFYYSQAARMPDGNVALDSALRFAENDYRQLKEGLETESTRLSAQLFDDLRYRRPFVTLLNCETRLNIPSTADVTRLDQPPLNPLNVLYRNKGLLKDIGDAIRNQFTLQMNLLSHKQTQIDLGLAMDSAPSFDSAAEDLQAEFEKVEAWKSQNFMPVEEIGHGIRSMLRILISLLDPVNQVFLVDEPEMHLYPSHKRWVGRQLAELARKQKKQIFVVTHDATMLQGVLDTRGSSTIFRFDKDDNGNYHVKPCLLENITDVGAIRNQASYLQALFYQRCIVVEGASDRAFYQTMVEDYPEVADKDLGFVACGGKGSSKHVAHITSHVGLRCAFIYDFDALLTDVGTIQDICAILGGDASQVAELGTIIAQFGPADQARKSRDIKDAATAGIESSLVQHNHEAFDKAIRALNSVGIFFVPYGTLESWAPDVEPKVRFSDKAPDVVRSNPSLKARFDQFIQPILRYLGC